MKKIVLLAFFIIHVFMLHLNLQEQQQSQSNPPPRIRKSIRAMSVTQRKSFFWSLKALAVLPAPKSYDYFFYDSLVGMGAMSNLTVKRQYSPKPRCLHDILIASHQTAAQHRSFYFSSYHRHWLIHYEIWLNFAHDVLKGGKEKLLQHYPADVYENYSSYWDAVFADYKNEKMSEIVQMAAHYWNPTNYKIKEEILFPPELANPKNNDDLHLDNMDKLLFAVRNHYAWDINVRTRFVTDDYKWDEKDIVQRLRGVGYFNKENYKRTPYTPDEINLQNGKLSARVQPQGQTFQTFNQTFLTFLKETGDGVYKKHSNARQEDYFFTFGNKERIPVNNMTQEELYVNYGAEAMQQVDGELKLVKHSYISKAERRALNLAYHNTIFYNKRLPHYTFAYALFNKLNIPNYAQYNQHYKGIGTSHSKMHNYHGNAIEIIGLNIYVFHGWIECEMEMKIRMCNNQDKIEGNKKQYEAFSNYLRDQHRAHQGYMFKRMLQNIHVKEEQDILYHEMREQLRIYYQNLAKINGSEFDQPISQNYTGFYTVFQWLNPHMPLIVHEKEPFDPNVPNSTIVFPVRDYMITPTRIRTSFDLNDIYNRIYIKLVGDRFKGFVDLTKYNFNFNYEIYHGPEYPTQILNEAGSNWPKYLQEMREDVEQEIYDILDSNINSTIDFIYHDNFEHFNNLHPKVDELHRANPTGNYLEIKSYLINHYTDYLHNMTYSFAQYPSSKKNGLYEIRMKLDPHVSCSQNLTHDLKTFDFDDHQIAQLTTDGIVIQHLNIFVNKGPQCRDCPATRKIYLDTDADLLETNLPLWKSIRKMMTGLNETLVYDEDAGMPMTFTQCFAQNVKLYVPENLTEGERPVEVWPVNGVQQFTIFVDIQGLPESEHESVSGSLIVEAKVASGTDPNNVILIAAKTADRVVGAKFEFPRLNHKSKEAIQNDLNAYLYTQIEVGWQQDQKKGIMTKYTIPHFSTQANFRLVVTFQNNENINNFAYLRFQDMDYHFKRRLFDHFHDTL